MEAKAALGGKLDALGGSSAGVPINEECVWCDCFPRVSPADFQKTVVPIFKNWATALNGDVQHTALPPHPPGRQMQARGHTRHAKKQSAHGPA